MNVQNLYTRTIIICVVLLSSWASANTENVVTLMRKAHELYAEDNLTQAIHYYKRAQENGGNAALCFFNVANAYFRLDSLSSSIFYYLMTISQAPDFYRAHLNLSVVYFNIDELGESIASAQRAIDLEPDSIKAYQVKAAALKKVGVLPDAATLYLYILEKDPQYNDAYISLGEIFRDLDDPQEAIYWLSRYPSHAKNYPYVLHLLADVYESVDDKDKTLYYLKRVLDIKPDNKWLYYRIVKLLNEENKPYLAIDEVENALLLYPDFAEIAVMGGTIAFELGDLSRAEFFFERAQEQGSSAALVGLENVRIMRLRHAMENQ